MKVLVTGGLGFIGTHLAKRCLAEGWETWVIDRDVTSWMEKKNQMKGITVRVSDISDWDSLGLVKSQGFDAIFHEAAVPRVSYSVEHPAETTNENTYKTVQLLEAAKGNVGRFIFASSSSVYGGGEKLPISENDPLAPKSPYALQKKVCEEFCSMFSNLYDMDTVCLRYFNVFGPGQKGNSPYSTAVSAWCHAIKHGLPLRKDGTGEQSRDMCFVDNVVDANILAAKKEGKFQGDCFNIACGDRTSNNEILEYFQKNCPDLVIQEAPFRAGDVMHTQAHIARAKYALGYEPKVRFWEGLDRTLDWWKI